MFIYVIEEGDSLYQIANRFGSTIDDISRTNTLNVNDTLVIGQAIVIPVDDVVYTVQSGDTLYRIARNYQVPLNMLIRANDLGSSTTIYPGQKLVIPYENFDTFQVLTNGFVLPGINEEIFGNTLPYLNYLSIFSYEVMEDGNVRPVNDERYITQAKTQNVRPLMTITNINGTGFSGEVAHQIFVNDDARNNLFNEILHILNDKGFYGLVVDFEYLYPDDRDAYTDFLENLSQILRQNGYLIAVAVAPKTSEFQTGNLYQAHDYEAIGRIADMVIIMTYEWGYLYGDPQAISPANKIEDVIKYAVTQIPSNKILLGVSNYAYDWTLPYVRGSAAMYLSNMQALDLARKKGSNIQFDEVAMSPFFTYYEPNAQHIVWFEDARSLYAKLNIVTKYNLLGISYWNINYWINPSGIIERANI